jgi:hypothetical protein
VQHHRRNLTGDTSVARIACGAGVASVGQARLWRRLADAAGKGIMRRWTVFTLCPPRPTIAPIVGRDRLPVISPRV